MGSYKGPGGLSGLVTVWITDDERALPVRAKMKVSVGPVTLTLLPEPADERPPHASPTPRAQGRARLANEASRRGLPGVQPLTSGGVWYKIPNHEPPRPREPPPR